MKRLFLIPAIVLLLVSSALSAQQTVTNGETMGQARTKINANDTELYGQAGTKWVSGRAYTASNNIVAHGGVLYVCSSNHTAGASTEPNVGASWATVWKVHGIDHFVQGDNTMYSQDSEPATCAVGDVWIDTNGTSGQRMYTCESANTWVAQAGGSGTDDQTASEVPFTPNGSIASTDVQNAIQEVRDEAGGNIDAGSADGDLPIWDVSDNKYVPTAGLGLSATSPLAFNSSTGELSVDLSGYQTALVSGTSIKTVNSTSLLGSGNIAISSSLSFDTFPTYEDSAHTSGIAVNGTTLAVYSSTAGKWLTVGLSDTLDPTPVMRTLTVTDPGNNDNISCADADLSAPIDCGDGASDCSATAPDGSVISGITGTADTGREWVAWTGDITGTAYNDGTVTLSANKSGSATFDVYDSCNNTPFDSETTAVSTFNVGYSTTYDYAGLVKTSSGTQTVCSMDAYMQKLASLSGKTLYIERWSTNSSTGDLVSKQEDITSIDANTISTTAGWVAIPFGKTVTLSQYDAIVITFNEVTGTVNFLRWFYNSTGTMANYRGRSWSDAGVAAGTGSNTDMTVKLYAPL